LNHFFKRTTTQNVEVETRRAGSHSSIQNMD
jgi:hypothetical protein